MRLCLCLCFVLSLTIQFTTSLMLPLSMARSSSFRINFLRHKSLSLSSLSLSSSPLSKTSSVIILRWSNPRNYSSSSSLFSSSSSSSTLPPSPQHPPIPTPLTFSCSSFHALAPPTPSPSSPQQQQVIKLNGWIKSVRSQKKISFISLSDGSHPTPVQLVIDHTTFTSTDAIDLTNFTTGASLSATGTISNGSRAESPCDFNVLSLTLLGQSDPATYPLSKKRHTLEYLRTQSHFRARTNTIASVARVRSFLSYEIHTFFNNEGFVMVDSPIITKGDCEGGGEVFRVTTLPLDDISMIATVKTAPYKDAAIDLTTGKRAPVMSADFRADFFGSPTYLSVSGQLSAEASAACLGKVYTFGPTFRSENSQTSRHLSEFHMLEPELSFCDVHGAMDNAEELMKHLCKRLLEKSKPSAIYGDIEFFKSAGDGLIRERLEVVRDSGFPRITYTHAMGLIRGEIRKGEKEWKYPDLKWGDDLNTEHERWLAETHFKSPVFVYNYPEGIKSFYMRVNDEGEEDELGVVVERDEGAEREGRLTVASFDLLVPGIGELIGGSQREERHSKLMSRMDQKGIPIKDYWWYLDLRKYGTVVHSGYGLGFERLVCWITGTENIRDAIPFGRSPGSAEF